MRWRSIFENEKHCNRYLVRFYVLAKSRDRICWQAFLGCWKFSLLKYILGGILLISEVRKLGGTLRGTFVFLKKMLTTHHKFGISKLLYHFPGHFFLFPVLSSTMRSPRVQNTPLTHRRNFYDLFMNNSQYGVV